MDCRETCARIQKYMDGALTVEELEPFIKHIETCPECYEELEVYYTLQMGLKQLDDDNFMGNGSRNALKLTLAGTKETIQKIRLLKIIKYAVTTVAFWHVVLVLFYQLKMWF